jgi:hypothetical protein
MLLGSVRSAMMKREMRASSETVSLMSRMAGTVALAQFLTQRVAIILNARVKAGWIK